MSTLPKRTDFFCLLIEWHLSTVAIYQRFPIRPLSVVSSSSPGGSRVSSGEESQARGPERLSQNTPIFLSLFAERLVEELDPAACLFSIVGHWPVSSVSLFWGELYTHTQKPSHCRTDILSCLHGHLGHVNPISQVKCSVPYLTLLLILWMGLFDFWCGGIRHLCDYKTNLCLFWCHKTVVEWAVHTDNTVF